MPFHMTKEAGKSMLPNKQVSSAPKDRQGASTAEAVPLYEYALSARLITRAAPIAAGLAICAESRICRTCVSFCTMAVEQKRGADIERQTSQHHHTDEQNHKSGKSPKGID
jgi:hypothetical protein